MRAALTIAFILPCLMAGASRDIDFGRFETSVRDCRTEHDGVRRSCTRLQLMQRGSLGLRIRFSGSGDRPGSSTWLTFVAAQPSSGRQPLTCERGVCQLSPGDWSAKVISGSSAHFDARGLPDTLPRALPMRGICRIQPREIRCKGQATQGISMNAEARF